MRARPRLSVFTIVYVALCRDAGWEPYPRPRGLAATGSVPQDLTDRVYHCAYRLGFFP